MSKRFYMIRTWIIFVFMAFAPCMQANTAIDSLSNELKKTLTDSQRIATLNRLYQVYMDLDFRKEANDQLNQALDLAVKTGDKKQLALVYYNLGSYHNSVNTYVVAFAHSMQALLLYRELKDNRGQAATLMNLGITYYLMKEYTEALSYYNQAELLYTKNREPQKVDIIKYLSALVYLQKGWPNAALRSFKQVIASDNKTSEQRKNECFVGMGAAFLKMGITDSADIYINAAYLYFDSLMNKEGKSYTGAKLAELYLDEGEAQKAIDSGLVNLKIAIQINNQDVQLQLYNVLLKSYFKLGDFSNAFTCQQKYYELKDNLFVVNEQKYSSLEKKYVEDEYKHKMVVLEQQRRNRTLTFNAIIGILILVLASLVYRFVLKQRVNRKLKVSNQKLEDYNLKLESANQTLNNTLDVLKQTQEKLLQQEKIASLGKVTAGIAHEIQNPLNFVTNFATINNDLFGELQGSAAEEDRKEAMLLLRQNNEKIRQHGLRANAIVREMLLETREDAIPMETGDINKLIRENFDFSYQAFKTKSTGFNCDTKLYIGALPKILMDQRRLGRVFLNLFDNALYALKDKLAAEPGFKPRVIIKTAMQNGFIQIVVEDNGKGIAPEIMKDIFNPFYTTKPTGDGTGLGLSICYDIITKRHHGMINVQSEMNQFTRFIIDLPILVHH